MAPTAPAASRALPDPQPNALWSRLLPEAGMPAAPITRVAQDQRGFLWFASRQGLVQYDGTRCRIFRHDPADPFSIGDDSINDLVEDGQGNLWIATQRGLDKWDRKTERFTRHLVLTDAPSLPEWTICRILLNPDGTLWLASFWRGLFRYNPATGETTLHLPAGPANAANTVGHIHTLLRDRQGHLWIGSDAKGLSEYDPATGALRNWLHDPKNSRSLIHNDIRALAEDHAGNLWIGSEKGLSRLPPERQFFEHFRFEYTDPGATAILALLVDRAGRVWIGGDSGGVRFFEPKTQSFTRFSSSEIDPHTLVSDWVGTMFEDRDGDIWVGHHPAGVSHFNALHLNFRLQRRSPELTNTLTHRSVLAFLEDPDGTLWVGTDGGGINRLDPASGLWSSLQHDPDDATSLASNSVLSLLRDHQGVLWVGTWNGGLNRLDEATGQFRHYTWASGQPDSLTSMSIWRVAEDQQHRIWVGTANRGISRYLPATDNFERFQAYDRPARSADNSTVWSFCVTRDATVWAGTSAGLARYLPESNTWKYYRPEPGKPHALNNDTINDVLEDRNGILWLATHGGGLNRFDPRTEHFSAFRESDGLTSDIVMSVLQDEQGRLWMATNKGLGRFDPQTRDCRTYDEGDGLPSTPFNRGARLHRRSGELLFGCYDGFVAFHPNRIVPDTSKAPVVLTRFEVFNEPQQPGAPDSPLTQSIVETQRIEIPARFSIVGFQFAALGYRAPERTRYEYRLEGFDADWRKAGPERRATYTNLAPGQYRFLVRAANREGQWNTNGTGLELIVHPAWWQLWWVRGLTTVGLFAIALAIGWKVSNERFRARVREAERERSLALERQHAAEMLRQRDEQYALAIDATRDGVFDWDLHTQNQTVSPRWREIHDLTPDPTPLSYAEWKALIHPDDLPRVEKIIREHLAGHAPLIQCEYRVRDRQQRYRWVFCQAKAQRDTSGQPARLVGAVADVTEHKQAEAERERLQTQLIQAQKMESVGRLAGGVAHDFNNMLQAILGNAALLQEAVPPTDPLRENVEEIQKAAQRSADLTRQLLAFARKQTISPQVIDLNNAVFGTLKMLQRLIGESIQLAWIPGANLWPIKIDPSQIDQILANLTVNARDAITGTGKITIETANVSFDSSKVREHSDSMTGDFVQLVVSDTGHGMDQETRSHLFEPFFTTKRVGEGTGLGLATIYGIVKQNGGFINVYSEPGRGSAFKIFLPRVAAGTTIAASIPAPRSLRGTETVLLVEDEAQILQLGRRILERQGYHVLAARLPAEALTLATQHVAPIHLLITDVVMPTMNGRELQEQLAKIKPAMRCLFMSGYTADVIAHQGVLAEGVHFMQKPFSNDSLCRIVREVLDAPLSSPAPRP
ncbi:MAG: PAS domain-containing protein [Opitutae bacterium]|nr:PAS domain-containing protein [Opitutae bacterium]